MTTGALLDSLSTVTNVPALKHLQNIECEEGGTGVVINSEMIEVVTEYDMELETMDDSVEVEIGQDAELEITGDDEEITTETEVELDGIC